MDSRDSGGSYPLGMDVARWRGVGHTLVVDVLPAVVVSAVMVQGSGPAARGQVPPRRPLDLLAWALMGVAAAVLLGRRRWPLGVLAVTAAASVVYLLLEYPYGPILVAMTVATYSVAVRFPPTPSLVACGVTLLIIVVPDMLAVDPGRLLVEAPLLLAVLSGLLLPAWAIGTVVRLGQEAERRARQDETQRRVYQERLRIAREVHDVVGHSLAVINLQAGVALHVVGRRPDQAEVALAAIKRSSKEALEELRGTLAVFRQPEPASADGTRRPTPGLGQLDALAAAMAEGGLPVEVAVTGRRTSLPAAVDAAAYRIVQESLTNVARHASPATATVRVDYQPDAMVLEIADTGAGQAPARPAGSGIAGMRERAAAVGGTLQAGPGADGGFLVRASLPLEGTGG
jgi:signal transduction histidine kinase